MQKDYLSSSAKNKMWNCHHRVHDYSFSQAETLYPLSNIFHSSNTFSPWKMSSCLLSLWFFAILSTHKSGSMQHFISFCDWLPLVECFWLKQLSDLPLLLRPSNIPLNIYTKVYVPVHLSAVDMSWLQDLSAVKLLLWICVYRYNKEVNAKSEKESPG